MFFEARMRPGKLILWVLVEDVVALLSLYVDSSRE
jgi:hypothetical protein